jgi:predicted Zn finger-like uncharacterized protein
MLITFACPSCHTRLAVDDDLAGKKIKCRNCDARVVVPEPETMEPMVSPSVAAGGPGGFEMAEWLLRTAGTIALTLGGIGLLIWLMFIGWTTLKVLTNKTPDDVTVVGMGVVAMMAAGWSATLASVFTTAGLALGFASIVRSQRRMADAASSRSA